MKRIVKTLSHKALYDMLSAVRGPDMVDIETSEFRHVLKCHLTGRIRFLLFTENDIRNNGGIITPMRMSDAHFNEVAKVLDNAKSSVVYSYMHYLRHLGKAIEATKENRIWGGNSYSLLSHIEYSLQRGLVGRVR